MTDSEVGKNYTLEADEKATPVMVYTPKHLVWGEVVTKEVIRLSTWLRTQAAPQYICLHESQMMYVGGGPVAIGLNGGDAYSHFTGVGFSYATSPPRPPGLTNRTNPTAR
jgi:hypothetical protein